MVSAKSLITIGFENSGRRNDIYAFQNTKMNLEAAKWIAEKHIIKVYVGTDGLYQEYRRKTFFIGINS